jgi:hypothetical protein
MAINTKGPANKRPGTFKGKASAAENKGQDKNIKLGVIDSGYDYADFATTKIGIGKDKTKG